MSYIKRLNVLAARRQDAAAAGAIVPGLTVIGQPGSVTHSPMAFLVTRQQLRAEARRQAKVDRHLSLLDGKPANKGGAPAVLQHPGADGHPEDPAGVDHGQIMGGESEALE